MNHAIVAAVSRYPRWPDRDLDGPLNDLVDFGTWLLEGQGGGIDPASAPEFAQWLQDPVNAPVAAATDSAVQFFVSPAAQPSVGGPVPLTARVEQALHDLHFQGNGQRDPHGNPRIGERLYLYFAGHGFAPDKRETALFLADAGPSAPGLHVVATAYADHFVDGGFFDDVVLVMDCCRGDGTAVVPRRPPFTRQRRAGAPAPSKPFFALAASWDQKSREEPHDGKVRGVFTRLLVEGLRGGAPLKGGDVTAETLERWVRDRIRSSSTGQVPDFDFDRASDHVIARPSVTEPNLRIRVAGDGAGTVRLEGGPDNAPDIAATVRNGALWSYRLDPGLYLATLVGKDREVIVRETMLGGPDDVLL